MRDYIYDLKVDLVIDGSTFVGWLDLGFDIQVRKRIKLLNIKCHNTHVPQGLESRQYVENFIKGRRLLIKTFRDSYRKYVTILGIIYVQNEQGAYINLNDELIEKHLAHPVKDDSNAVQKTD